MDNWQLIPCKVNLMNLQTFLEEWKHSFKIKKQTVEIFENPTKKEMRSVSLELNNYRYVRFIANDHKKIFIVFSPNIFHTDVANELKEKNPDAGYNNGLFGTAKFVDGKWWFDGADMGVPDVFN